MNAPTFLRANYYPAAFRSAAYSSGSELAAGEYPMLLTSAEQVEVEEALALTDACATCFNCCFGASFARSSQFWCSVACWQDVMNGGRDYWYDPDTDCAEEGELS